MEQQSEQDDDFAAEFAAAEMDRLRPVVPEPAKAQQLEDIEQYRLQMAVISTASFGYWKEGDSIHPDYLTPALIDVAQLHTKYETAAAERDALRAALLESANTFSDCADVLRRLGHSLTAQGCENAASRARAAIGEPTADPVNYDKLGRELVAILINHCGEAVAIFGAPASEGAVETLKRIIRERDAALGEQPT